MSKTIYYIGAGASFGKRDENGAIMEGVPVVTEIPKEFAAFREFIANAEMYELEEMTGTKLRAVYQRRKGRDLFDLWKILCSVPDLDKEKVMQSYERYLGFTASHLPTYKEFVMNMEEKLQDEEFLTDTDIILGPQEDYNPQVAWEKVHGEFVMRLIKE